MQFQKIDESNYDKALRLFDDGFYFLTRYPNIVSEIELKQFLLEVGDCYLVLNCGQPIGLFFMKIVNERVVFAKIMFTPKCKFNKEVCAILVKQMLEMISSLNSKTIKVETKVYSTPFNESEILENAGFVLEACKERELFIDWKYYDELIYAYHMKGGSR